MKKYLVDVYIPAIERHFDVYLPETKLVSEAAVLIAGLAESIAGEYYRKSPNPLLLDAKTGESLYPDFTVRNAGVQNASRLILL